MRSKTAVCAFVTCCLIAFAQTPNPINESQVVVQLTRTIAWYQHLSALDDRAAITENVLLRNNVRDFAKRAYESSFAFARAQSAALNTAPVANEAPSAPVNMQQSLTTASARVLRLQQRLQSLDTRIEQATGAQRQTLTEERSAIAADLALAKQMETAVKTITSFNSPKNVSGHGLLDIINSLESLNPMANTDDNNKQAAATQQSEASLYHPESVGIMVLASGALSFYRTSGRLKR